MKKFFTGIVVAFAATSTMISCDQNVDVSNSATIEQEVLTENDLTRKLTDAFMQIINNENGDYDEGGYIMYDAETGEMVACTEFVYCVGYAISGEELPVVIDASSDSKPICKTPSRNGWVSVGICEANPLATTKIIASISKKIPRNSNFEIHAEYDKVNKTYRVWYRIVKS